MKDNHGNSLYGVIRDRGDVHYRWEREIINNLKEEIPNFKLKVSRS